MPRYRLTLEFETLDDDSALEAARLARATFDFPRHRAELLREHVRPWVRVVAIELPPEKFHEQ